MLEKYEYEIVDMVCISKPLLQQMHESDCKIQKHDVYKAVLTRNGINTVGYLVDDVQVGQNSRIRILENKAIPILYPDDYKVLVQTKYIPNQVLLKSLLERESYKKMNKEGQ